MFLKLKTPEKNRGYESNHDNRGNFLEAIKLLTEYNRQKHLQEVILQGKQKNPSKNGSGKFVTF